MFIGYINEALGPAMLQRFKVCVILLITTD